NVMFPRSVTPRAKLSETQQRIVLGSTLYRAGRGAPPPPLWTTSEVPLATGFICGDGVRE
ncbi:MAG TPA: hypothetical protein VFB62_21115, partial [Polyangiaceae bacterium]|nr:hypothetical protein [Polyangiaceae bacterium]